MMATGMLAERSSTVKSRPLSKRDPGGLQIAGADHAEPGLDRRIGGIADEAFDHKLEGRVVAFQGRIADLARGEDARQALLSLENLLEECNLRAFVGYFDRGSVSCTVSTWSVRNPGAVDSRWTRLSPSRPVATNRTDASPISIATSRPVCVRGCVASRDFRN